MQRADNIRKFVVRATHLEDLVGLGTITAQAAAFLEAAVSVPAVWSPAAPISS